MPFPIDLKSFVVLYLLYLKDLFMANKNNRTHGLTVNGKSHPIYKTRSYMIYRCYSAPESHASYPFYRGKGIKICDEWRNDALVFYEWALKNGWKQGLSIDRIDSNKDYEPGNCRFISRSENSIKARSENNQRGVNNTNVKLNDDKVLAIKLLLRLGFNVRKIGEFFGVGKTTIVAINMGQTWKHIKEI